ncbi:MAG: hypothetical protein MK104_05240 [Erythrobacter sp.]|uniref:hypothetical protein n=1 Tax=Qipengyuania pacifica TaxID=2860199 RepID=UPI0035C7A565|nr:hypothetical protein [Erythrobacter sp.]
MSAATKDDLSKYLTQKRGELEEHCQSVREQNLADFGAKGLAISGPAMKGGATALQDTLSDYFAERTAEAPNWVGEQLPSEVVRGMFADHLRDVLKNFCVPSFAYRSGTRTMPDSAAKAFSRLVQENSAKLENQIRVFELDVSEKTPQPTVYNVVQAETVIGGIQQSAGPAMQTNTVKIDAEMIAQATDKLLAAIDSDELRKAIEPDLVTLQSQLDKTDPNTTIVRETGKSIRSIVEGAFGGAIGNAMAPQLGHALAVFTALLGI